jgi:hypothetical protein
MRYRWLIKHWIFLKLDFACHTHREAPYITTRHFLKDHLDDNGITPINDCRKVGDHCISWMGNTDKTANIQYRVYNKFVQMVESAEAHKSLGS